MRLLTILVTFGLLLGAYPSSVGRAENSAIYEIPGVTLPSTSIDSSIGGPTYDHVYSLNVVAGTVLLVTLRGEIGAELGLYLFDDQATSIYEATPFAVSAKPGSVQSVSTQFFREATIYINVNGRNEDRAYRYQLFVSKVVDRTPPVIRNAEVLAYVRPDSVCATIDAVDGISGVQSVRFTSGDASEVSDWVPYTGVKRYCGQLSLPEGRHEVVVAARNRIGMVTVKSAGYAQFDSDSPRVTRVDPPQSVSYSARPIAFWEFNEPVRSSASRTSRVLAYAQSGALILGRTWFSSSRRQMYWQPNEALKIGTLLSAVPAGVLDRAGNALTLVEPIVLWRKAPTLLSLKVEAVGPKWLRLRLSASQNLVGKQVVLSTRLNGAWTQTSTFNISSRSTLIKLPRDEATRYRVEWGGSDRLDVARSVTVGRPAVVP